jgi:very-short-patch-repair endonuclease
MTPHDRLLLNELERQRTRLLDLSASNRLLNFRHTARTSLRLVDELPGVIFERLSNHRALTFLPVPEPEREPSPEGPTPGALTMTAVEPSGVSRQRQALEEAERLGIDTRYELPPASAEGSATSRKHQDRHLQTLFFPEELEAHLHRLHGLAQTAIQETGANLLHLVFGFLRWYEPGDNQREKPRSAPLVLMPVSLKRLPPDARTRVHAYEVDCNEGEAIELNLTLQEKLKQEFGIALPAFNPDEGLEPYFAKVGALLKNLRPDWGLERQVTLTLLSFGRLLMWRDLEPSRWPEASPLLASPLVRTLLGARGETDEAGGDTPSLAQRRRESYDLDAPALAAELPPLITDADSSQHSVLVDVLRGESLVVQGPPGTGKSQTITNLIGAALAAGKTVLFVTQKLAALEVVSRRLQQAGLGDFCLELHSHKTQKQQFMEDLRSRLKQRHASGATSPLGSQVVNAIGVLRAHTDRLHAPFGALGMSPHDVFWKVGRAEAELGDALAELEELRIDSAEGVSSTSLEEAREAVRGLAAQLKEVRRIAPVPSLHPWSGVTNPALSDRDCQTLIERVGAWEEAALRLGESLEAFALLTGVAPRASVLAADALVSAVRVLPKPPGVMPPAVLPALLDATNREGLRALLGAIESVQQQWAGLEAGWRSREDLSASGLRTAEEVLGTCLRLLTPDTSLLTVTRAHEAVEKAALAVSASRRFAEAVAPGLGLESAMTPAEVQTLVRVVDAMAELDDGALEGRDARWTHREAEELLRTAARTCADLKEQARALAVRFMPELVPPVAILKAHAVAVATAPFIPWLSGAWRSARRDFQAMAHGVRPTRPVLIQAYNDLLAHHATRERFQEDAPLKALLGARFQGTDTRFERILSWVDTYRKVEAVLQPLGARGAALSRAVLELPASQWREAIARARSRGDDAAQAREVSTAVHEAATRVSLRQAPWNTEPAATAQDSLEALLRHLGEVLGWARLGDAPPSLPLSQLQAQVRRAREACEAADRLTEHTQALALLGAEYQGRKTSTAGPRSLLRYVDDVLAAPLPEGLAAWLLRQDTARRHADLGTHARDVETKLRAYQEATAQAWRLGQMAPGTWEDAASETPLMATVSRLRQARGRAGTLPGWCAYQRQRHAVARLRGTVPFLERIDTRSSLATIGLLTAFDAVFFRSLAEAVLREQPELDQFTGAVHAAQREEFARLDARFIQQQGPNLAQQLGRRPVPQGQHSQKVAGLTELQLIQHELGKKQRHLSIRELVQRAGNALQALMPCFMMGPQSVSQYLPPGQLRFDLVVMDEASQLRPEDALGAIARGGQLVVVGDPEQLPPTSFFAQLEQDDLGVDTEAGEEARGPSLLDESESILVAAAQRFPMRMLRWHYRSRHPALISFSNREFYNGDLIVFPAPGQHLEGLGVRFHRVANGLYESNRNEPEAREVLAAVKEHARARPDQSLLVVTLNSKQRDLIDDLVTAEEKTDAALRAFLSRWEKTPMPFDVKNLENVQGDERDAIFVSVTFGPDREQRFRMNFGPINQADGYRRLNVLFTRARCALTVFASFDPSDLKVQESSPRGMRVLQRYLLEAQGAVVAHGVGSGRPPDSDFEVAVSKALAAMDFDIVPQVGVAGYFIDLAIRHPRHPGRYILGVECDGERYHASRSARDRDRLRDQVLKGLGWKLHRIWSADWFRSPSEEVARIVAHVEALLREEAAAELLAVVPEEASSEHQMRAVSA